MDIQPAKLSNLQIYQFSSVQIFWFSSDRIVKPWILKFISLFLQLILILIPPFS